MKFVDEYRDAKLAQDYAKAIASITTKPWTIMEICGGQTHSIVKYGIDELLPSAITLIHGPGCPVCVTDINIIDQAIALASLPNIILCSFGDMLRVPGSEKDLLSIKATGADVRIVYNPLDCLKIAQQNPTKQVIFFAVGFETTAPTTAMAVYQAYQQNIKNFSLLVSHVLVPPAMEAILSSPNCQVQGFLAAGHVCTIMGYTEYEPIVEKYQIPIVVTGFEPVDILQGIYFCIQQLENGEYKLENQYNRSVRREGNETAKTIIQEIFEIVPRQWRGLGEISQSGLGIKQKYINFDAQKRFNSQQLTPVSSPCSECISGEILQGIKKPHQCSAFGTRCTPEHPLGAPMVSSEGACAAYYRYRQQHNKIAVTL
ncbi:hydrogenase formation protein HypD [Planktothrix sp. FACHB-1365]|uniref:hydrogenase formation protein HypD n=1 Tax=Planktothrix sp. FACHB-1365 TaxID=2692855 RepID=UPI00168A2BDB|nr:hydrogenase formation protein HypD [Planktothrix sp. FACHB-1365]MBD2483780.1 hydrogenase formation protein HypD [Planktothrix sp. FACHB-1365]